MKEPLSTLLIGVGGYGNLYSTFLLSDESAGYFRLVGVVDPYADQAPRYEDLKATVPIYDNMADFFAEQSADLTIICTPIHLHFEQCVTAFENGSHVLCEKPLVPKPEDLDRLDSAAGDKYLAVGFNWCSSEIILSLKQRILAGEFGRPLRLKSYTSWPRGWAYYNRGVKWAGKIKTEDGKLIYDSIASNATSHFIQNMLFLLGSSMMESASLSNVDVECYRANDIESFDTIAFRGEAAGAEIYFTASHATCQNISPVMDFEFEKARMHLSIADGEFLCTIYFKDDDEEKLIENERSFKAYPLISLAKLINGEKAYICTTDTVRPFTVLINEIFEKVPFNSFPESFIIKDPQASASYLKGQQPGVTYLKDLHRELWDCYEQFKLPSEAALPWASPATRIL